LETNTEGAIKKEKSRETGKIGYTRRKHNTTNDKNTKTSYILNGFSASIN
jgi:hypothetical protein